MSRFKMSDMGDVSPVLAMQVTRDSQAESLTITQEDYIMVLLVKYGMQDGKPSGTPGHGKELSLRQPEESFPDDEANQRFSSYCRQRHVPEPGDTLRHRVCGKPTGGGYVLTIEGSHGIDQASSSVSSRDGGFQHNLQARGVQAQRALRCQLGKQPGQR